MRQPWRAIVVTLLSLVLTCIFAANLAGAFNLYQDAWVGLSCRPLGMGGAFTAVSDPASVFYNPAGLAMQRQLTLLFNHSSRHFPGVEDDARHLHRVDQLDADTEAIVVPLPLATYAHGMTLSGEYGYDYRQLPPEYSYPRENVWGNEDYHSLAFSLGLPCAAGYSLRRQFLRLTPDPADTMTPAWLRLGQGEQWGILARAAPGLDYGYSDLRMDYDWTLLEQSTKPGERFAEMSSRLKTKRSGWALHPTGWLMLAGDVVQQKWSYPDDTGLGTMHRGELTTQDLYLGGELCLGNLAKFRWGNSDGSPTVGVGVNLGGLWLNYAEGQDMLPKLMGKDGGGFRDVHFYGAEVRF
jgi:hypothetical protein